MFRANPQDLPASRNVVAGVALALIGIHFIFDILHDSRNSLPLVLIEIVVFGLVVYGLLFFKGFAGRWQQTYSALLGAAVFFVFVSFPLIVILLPDTDGSLQLLTTRHQVGMVIMFMIAIWSFAVNMHILREALETTKINSFFITIGMILVLTLAVVSFYAVISSGGPAF